MTKHNSARGKHSRQADTQAEDQSSQNCAIVSNPQTPPDTRRVNLKFHRDFESTSLVSVNIEVHANKILNTPLHLSPTETASTASSPGISDAIWDSSTPSHLRNSEMHSDSVFTPSTPLTPACRGTGLRAEQQFVATGTPGLCEDSCTRQTSSRMKNLQEEDYFFKPKKLFRNLTDQLHAITECNRIPDQAPYNRKPEVEFAKTCTLKPPSPPPRTINATNQTAENHAQERIVKTEGTYEPKGNNTQRLNQRSKKPLHKILEHIVPISFQSRIAEDRRTCVASMVKDPNKRCTKRALGGNIDIEEICRSMEESDLEVDSTKFLELIAQLVEAVMCGTHRNSAMCRTRHEKLTGWVSNFSSLSDNIRDELQGWIEAIVHGTAPRDAQHSTQQPSLESTCTAGTRSQETRNNTVAVPETIKTGTAGIASTRTQLPWFKNYPSGRARQFSIQEALHREAIKPLQSYVPKEGYIYVYWDKISFGYVKIGHTNDLERRLNEWNKSCDHKHEYHPDVQRGELPQIAHVTRIELLIHIELRDHRKQRYCKKCKKNHIEWFQIGASSVMKVFRKWYEWIEQEPYAFDDKKGEWIVRPEMMVPLAQVCKPIAIDEKLPPPTPRRFSGVKKDRKSKGRAENYRH